MTREQVRAQIEAIGIIPAIRCESFKDALFAVETVAANGISIAEITLTVPHALELIAEVRQSHPAVVAGAGSISDVGAARRAADAGALFLTSTGLDLDIVRFGVERDLVVFPGVLTPTEIMAASKAGPDFVKIFPCAQVGGPAYLKAMRRPFPGVRFLASGGVNQQTATDYILAGGVALGIGSELIPPEAVRRRQSHWIGELARRFVTMVKEARELQQPDHSPAVKG